MDPGFRVREIGTTLSVPLAMVPLTKLSESHIQNISGKSRLTDTHSGVCWYSSKVIITGSAITALSNYLDLSEIWIVFIFCT